MEPRIQYAQTKDGVSIAYWTLGEGKPLVGTPMAPFSHIQLEWQLPGQRRWVERITQTYRFVRYDGRGSGLSERSVTDFSLDAHVLDLEAVVDCLGLESFALHSGFSSGPVAIAYAARHPDRVSHLILWSAYARAADIFQSPRGEAFLGLLNKDWQLFTETLAHAFLGWSEDEPARKQAAIIREAVTPETARAAVAAMSQFDVTDILSDVKAPTLVQHRREAGLGMDIVTGLAALIPDASLHLVEGTSVGTSQQSDIEETVKAYEEFMGLAKDTLAPPKPLATEDVHTILFTERGGLHGPNAEARRRQGPRLVARA